MVQDPAFAQLVEMGIPGGRARAALRRAKGDVMAAAERVFGGEFDDIPSDDEGVLEAEEPAVSGLRTPEEQPVETAVEAPIVQRVAQNIVMTDNEDEAMEDDDSAADVFDGFEEEDVSEDRLFSDPYAGIFFSKDRVEKIIETVEEPEYAEVRTPPCLKVEEEKIPVRILGLGEWMSGCPEGNEQSFLFQLYNFLAQGEVKCSMGCGHSFKREKQDFFAILPEFPAYLSHLRSVVRPICTHCGHVTCLACGERPDQKQLKFDMPLDISSRKDRSTGKAKEDPEVFEIDELLHCVNIQGVLIGVGLHMIEQAFGQGRAGASPTPQGRPTKKRKTDNPSVKSTTTSKSSTAVSAVPTPDSDVHHLDDEELYVVLSGPSRTEAKKAAKGTGYDGCMNEDRSGQMRAERAQIEADEKTALLLSQIQVYLPHLDRSSGTRTSDHLVHPTALAHLRRRSAFVHDLLRNDSLLDMSNRDRIYSALLDWLKIISGHEALSSMLAMPQMRSTKTEPLPNELGHVSVTYEGAPSPRELLELVVVQAQAALRGLDATAAKEEEENAEDAEETLRLSTKEAAKRETARMAKLKEDDNVQLRKFCGRIIATAKAIDKSLAETKGKDFVERMRESLPRLPDARMDVVEKDVANETDEAVIKIYEDWATKVRFQFADLTVPSGNGKKAYRHAYSANIVALENQEAPKRSLAIAKELAILTTNLPVAWHSTIFLRVDEARVDCLKAMIIGPEGTPYENGCFIFDIHLPIDYNFKCPLVKSMTTNGGRYRYNPNLYADGKVCLSLLGTWSGPSWISGQSTLLQVLISIQSLILCEEPYLNEPGWASDAGTPQSQSYSANVRRMVLVDAMANNMKNPPYPFEHEIKTHFRLKAKSLRTQLDKWKKLDDGRDIQASHGGASCSTSPNFSKNAATSKTAFDKASVELRTLLDALDFVESTGVALDERKKLEDKEGERMTRSKIAKVLGRK